MNIPDPYSTAWRNLLIHGLMLGGLAGLLLFAYRYHYVALLPMGIQFKALAFTWGMYAVTGLAATCVAIVAIRLLSANRQSTADSLYIWTTAAAPAALVWVKTGEYVSGSIFPVLATLAAAGSFAVWTRLARSFRILQTPAVWVSAASLVLLLVLSYMKVSGTGEQGVPTYALALVLPILVLQGVALWLCTAAARSRGALLTNAGAALAGGVLIVLMHIPPSGLADADNVIVISVDTLRADHLDVYAESNASTPNLTRFAEQSVLFEDATTAMPLTNPSHTSMMTGMYPGNHGVTRNRADPIDSSVILLPELLAEEGYITAAFVSAMPLAGSHSKLKSRFALYNDDIIGDPDVPDIVERDSLYRLISGSPPPLPYRPSERTVSDAIEWLHANQSASFMLFLHLFDPHGPYQAHAGLVPGLDDVADSIADSSNYHELTPSGRLAVISDPAKIDYLSNLYAGEVSYVDTQLGRLFSELETLGLLEKSVIVFVSDHGESLTEHNYFFGHSADLYQPALHVPFMIRFPDGTGAGRRVSTPVCTTDIMPTLLEYLDFYVPGQLDGRSLLGLARNGHDAEQDRYIVSTLFARDPSWTKGIMSVRSQHYKYIRTSPYWYDMVMVPGRTELYDLETDPDEQQNIMQSRPELLRELSAVADRYRETWNGLRRTSAAGDGQDDFNVMRALGYIR